MRMHIQSPEERLADVDRVILDTCKRGSELLANGAPVSEVDVQVDFMRHLYQRRDLILNELKRAGITEKEAYAHIRSRKEVYA